MTKHRLPRLWPSVAFVAAVIALGLLLVGCAVPDATLPPNAGGYVPVAPAAAPTIAPPRPAGVTIPRLGVTSTLIETGILPDGTAETPPVEQPEQASWLRESPVPGEIGPAVLYGHVDGNGRKGVFADLGLLRDGDQIVVQRDGAPDVAFEVYEIQEVAKTAFPSLKVYGDTEGPELRLVTCGGQFDRASGHYTDNVVAYARLAAT